MQHGHRQSADAATQHQVRTLVLSQHWLNACRGVFASCILCMAPGSSLLGMTEKLPPECWMALQALQWVLRPGASHQVLLHWCALQGGGAVED